MIEFRNICKSYVMGNEKVHALKNVSFQIDKGEFVAVIGPSGSGKSTLMNIMGCLDRPSSGEYYLNNINVLSANDDKLAELRNREIGFIFQSFNLLPKLNIIENVELPLIYRGFKKNIRIEKALKAIELVGLAERIHHRPNELSGGQQQRVAIARAIVGNPEIILADEPTGNLDSKSGKEIMATLSELNNIGKTIIIITHDLVIAQQAHRVFRILDGQLVDEDKIRVN